MISNEKFFFRYFVSIEILDRIYEKMKRFKYAIYLMWIFTLWNISDETMLFVIEVDEYECTQYKCAYNTCKWNFY